MRKLLILPILLSLFFYPVLAFAQTTVRTRVGSPPQNSGALGVAKDLKASYDKCSGGSTVDKPGLGDCLRADLLYRGYSYNVLDAFEARRKSSLVFHDGPLRNPTICTECLGYVALVLTLLSGSTNTLTQLSAAGVYPLTSFTAGSLVFNSIGPEPLLPGDIGAKGGGSGHIVIVNDVRGNIKFTALESNGNYDCRVTDAREINREPYNFFRMQ